MEAAVILTADLSIVLAFDAPGGKGDTREYPTAVLVLRFPIMSPRWLCSIKDDYRTHEDLLLWKLRSCGSQMGVGHSGFISVYQEMRVR